MAQADPPLPAPSGGGDPVQQVLDAVSGNLSRRGYLTTEWWTTILGGAVSAVLALVNVKGSTATHVAAVVSPALLAALYAITRTMHKSALASAVSDLFPQAGQPVAPAAQGQPGQPGQPQLPPATAAASVPAPPAPTAIVQTDPDFAFEGIPPIEEADG